MRNSSHHGNLFRRINTKNGYYSDGYYEYDQIVIGFSGIYKAKDNDKWYNYNPETGGIFGYAESGIYAAADGKYRNFDGNGNGVFEIINYRGNYLQDVNISHGKNSFIEGLFYHFNGDGTYSLVSTGIFYLQEELKFYYSSGSGYASLANGIAQRPDDNNKWCVFSNGVVLQYAIGVDFALNGLLYLFDYTGNGALYNGDYNGSMYVDGVLV